MTVLTFGETMALAAATATGPLAHASTLTPGIGGAESNVAIAFACTVAGDWEGYPRREELGLLTDPEPVSR